MLSLAIEGVKVSPRAVEAPGDAGRAARENARKVREGRIDNGPDVMLHLGIARLMSPTTAVSFADEVRHFLLRQRFPR